MAACVLRAVGDAFDPDAFLVGSTLSPCVIWRKGEARSNARPPSTNAGLNVVASTADDLSSQIKDVVHFLNVHRPEVFRLRHAHGLNDMVLDFGVPRREGAAQFNRFPSELVALAGGLGIGIELSSYETSLDPVVEAVEGTPVRSIHDNSLYAYEVRCDLRQLILRTSYHHGDVEEYTDVIFSGVTAHHFENVLAGNILFGIDEVQVQRLVCEWTEVFTRSKAYAWPDLIEYTDAGELVAVLGRRGVKAFEIGSSLGLSGWVLATEMKVRAGQRPQYIDDFKSFGKGCADEGQ